MKFLLKGIWKANMSLIRKHIQKMSTYKPPLEGRNPKDFLLLDFNERMIPIGQNIKDTIGSFFLDYALHKDKVEGYHVVNLVIHVLAGIFLYLLIAKTLSLPSVGFEKERASIIAWVSSMVWFVHPLQTESVT